MSRKPATRLLIAACLLLVLILWPQTAPAPIVMWDLGMTLEEPSKLDLTSADPYNDAKFKPYFMVCAFSAANGQALGDFTVKVMQSGEKKVLTNTSTEIRTPALVQRLPIFHSQAVAYARAGPGQYHVWVSKKGYETKQRNFYVRQDSAEVIKVYLQPRGGSAAPPPTEPPRPGPIIVKGVTPEPEVASIKGYGKDLSDNSAVCFFSDFPNLSMSDNPKRCKTKSRRANASWAGYYKFLDRNRLVLMMRNIKAPAPPANLLAIGYTVRLRHATFKDGSTKKTFVMMKFRRKPTDISANKVVDIVPKPGAARTTRSC